MEKMEPRMKSPAVAAETTATVPRVVPKELISTRKQELKSAGGAEDEDGSVRKCINPKYASSANDTKLNLDTKQIHKDEIQNQDKGLYNLGGSDGEDATGNILIFSSEEQYQKIKLT
ncbi:uncharacterized protein LOC123531919 [Mercenaria mercenaria]|uniref:uncharacterized protein LOC123531919 n=1 Tax=Mercenaria mercenaria TaxID=6596 RepID=UPI00234FAC1F|nr:uncharacterized protein LOC123531919 [Mercenaria mercenaria]